LVVFFYIPRHVETVTSLSNSAIIGATGNMAAWLGMLGSFIIVSVLVLLMGVISALLYMKLHPPNLTTNH